MGQPELIMATLKSLGASYKAQKIRFVGDSMETNKVSSDGIKYFVWQLAEEIKVYCSTEASLEPQVVKELFIRQTDLDADVWEKDEIGFFAVADKEKGTEYLADFSINQEICIYQPETIRAWARDDRKSRSEERRSSLLNKLNKGKKS